MDTGIISVHNLKIWATFRNDLTSQSSIGRTQTGPVIDLQKNEVKNGPFLMSYVTEGHEIDIAAGVHKNDESVWRFVVVVFFWSSAP